MSQQDESLLIIYILISLMLDKIPNVLSLDCLKTLAGCSTEMKKLVNELEDQVSVSDLIQQQFQARFAKNTIH